MGLFKEVIHSVSDYWRSTQLPDIDNSKIDHTKHSFNSNDPPGVWKPLLTSGLFDYAGTESAYRSFAYACINKKAYNVSKGTIQIYRKFKSKQTLIEDHPFLKLLTATNSINQSWTEIFWLSAINCDLFGNAYILVNRVSFLGKDMPVELVPLPAKFVQPYFNSQGTMIDKYRFNGSYGVGGVTQLDISPRDIIHFKIPNLLSNLLGKAPVTAFNFQIDIEYQQARSQNVFFQNDAKPSIAISTTKSLNDDKFQQWKQRWSEAHSGVSNRNKPLFLDEDGKVQQLSQTAKEMDFIQSRQQILDEIMLILDVSKQVMGNFSDSNYNNAKSAILSWMENTIQPYANLVFNPQLTNFVQKNYDDKLVTEIDYPIVDMELKLKEIEISSKHNLETKNELRKKLDAEPYVDQRADDLFYVSPQVAIRDTINDPSVDPNLQEDIKTETK